MKISYVIIWIVNAAVMSLADQQCDLNNDICFRRADKRNWTFNYVRSKQEYIEVISQGKSHLINPYRKKPYLPKRDGVKIGHVEKVTFEDGKTVDVITKATKPFLFEIPKFLSDEECEHIIKRAQDPNEGGMFQSKAKGGMSPIDRFKPTGIKGKAKGYFGNFKAWDTNADNQITVQEVIELIHRRKLIILKENHVYEMFDHLEMTDVLEDGFIDLEEFETLNTYGIEEYTEIIYREDARFKDRHSNQAWLMMEQWVDPTIHNMREKLVKLTGLPREIIYGGEKLQVVQYKPLGHYHAHMDSEFHYNSTIPCCHQQREDMATTEGKCKICRYLTFMMYLNDVEEGGETAFPIADDTEEIDERRIRGNSTTDKFNLSHNCKRANVLVKPEKGKAVLWYNHHRDDRDGWLGKLDLYSLHGGCDVIKGEKWISNMWINAPYDSNKKMPSAFLNWYDLHLAEEEARV